MSENLPKCHGVDWINCDKVCEFEESCKLEFQENVAGPRLEKELESSRDDI